MGIAFTRPEFLLLLPVAGLLLWLSARVSYADLSRTRLWLAWGVRSVLVLALVLALAGVQIIRISREMVVVFALDGSFSVPAAERFYQGPDPYGIFFGQRKMSALEI